jgi:DNA invertase Pin-like site-specific DNA recombinase
MSVPCSKKIERGNEVIIEREDHRPVAVIPIRQFMAALFEYERKMIVLKLRGVRQRTKAKRGRCEGRKPFGSLPGESATLARMLELRHSGATITAIAETLNVERRTTRAGGKCRQPTISKLLNRGRNAGA